MEIIVALGMSTLFAFSCKTPLKRYAWVFYVGAIATVALFSSHIIMETFPLAGRTLYPYLQRCLLAFGLFAVVMFIGVLPQHSRMRKLLAPIRGELSIIASILALGHIANYLNAYLAQFLSGFAGMPRTAAASFTIAFIVLAMLAILTATSFNVVRKHMQASTWKRIQLLSYPFFLLTYAHLMFLLAPAGATLDGRAFMSIIVYTAIIATYGALRSIKAVRDYVATAKMPHSDISSETM